MGSQASGGGQGGGSTTLGPDFQLFELVQREDGYSSSGIVGAVSLRQTHVEFLSHIRLTDYRKAYDTLTVSPQLVDDADQFFDLMAQITDSRAFSEPLQLSGRAGRA